MTITYRTFQPEDVDPVNALQKRYAEDHPGAITAPAELYLSPYLAGGANVLVARAEDGAVLAYAPFFQQNDLAWVEIRALPGVDVAVKNHLLAWLVERARQGGQARLCFQYTPGEVESIAYAEGQGAQRTFSIFNLHRPLRLPLPECPLPAGFTMRRWRMESEAEQRQYLAGRNLCFPEAPTSLEEWQYFTTTPHWAEGLNIAAFAGDELAASVLTYWEPGGRAGATENVFTLPEYRGKGLARALLAEALRYLKEHGLQVAILEVKAENVQALNVYLGLGYERVGETRVFELVV